MAQEKPTSIRMLQSNKKKSKSPIIYIVIGILAGVFVSISLFLLLSQTQSPESVVASNNAVEESINDQESVHDSFEQNRSAVNQVDDADSTEQDGFVQPKENELSNIFKPLPNKPIETHTQRASPFDAQLTGEKGGSTVKQAVVLTKPSQQKVETVQPKPLAKPQIASTKPTEAPKAPVAEEPEAEPPKATVDIKVTRSPFAVN